MFVSFKPFQPCLIYLSLVSDATQCMRINKLGCLWLAIWLSLVHVSQVPNITKLLWMNKLECLSIAFSFSISNTRELGQSLTAKLWLEWRPLQAKNVLAYCHPSVCGLDKRFYKIEPKVVEFKNFSKIKFFVFCLYLQFSPCSVFKKLFLLQWMDQIS